MCMILQSQSVSQYSFSLSLSSYQAIERRRNKTYQQVSVRKHTHLLPQADSQSPISRTYTDQQVSFLIEPFSHSPLRLSIGGGVTYGKNIWHPRCAGHEQISCCSRIARQLSCRIRSGLGRRKRSQRLIDRSRLMGGSLRLYGCRYVCMK
jgi:hypothetical protein